MYAKQDNKKDTFEHVVIARDGHLLAVLICYLAAVAQFDTRPSFHMNSYIDERRKEKKTYSHTYLALHNL